MSENEKVTMGKKTFILSIIGAAAAASVLSFGMFTLAGRLSGADKADSTQEQNQPPTQLQIPSQNSTQEQGQAPNQGFDQGKPSAQTPNPSQNPNQSQTSPTPNAGDAVNPSASDSYIGEESAWSIALTHAGLKESEISKKQIKLDLEDGIMVYEIEFDKGWIEYEYEINAVNGEIIKAEKD